MKMSVKTWNPLPAGQYLASFVGLSQIETQHGGAAKWEFSIESPVEYKERLVSKLTATEATSQNSAGKVLRAITGKLEDADLEVYFDKKYNLVLSVDDQWNKVEAIFPAV